MDNMLASRFIPVVAGILLAAVVAVTVLARRFYIRLRIKREAAACAEKGSVLRENCGFSVPVKTAARHYSLVKKLSLRYGLNFPVLMHLDSYWIDGIEQHPSGKLMDRLPKRINLRDQIHDILKKRIILKEIGSGEKINEEELARALGVSRTPIRETLLRLEHEGIVKIIPRRGAFVVSQSLKEVIDLLQVREVLEGLVVRLATEKMERGLLDRAGRFVTSPVQGPGDG